MCDNVTVNLFKVLGAAMDLRPGRSTIVAHRGEFPTDRYVATEVARQRGGSVRWIGPLDPDATQVDPVNAGDVAAALEFMTDRFGPPPLPEITVSPIPGSFGQGFPGLIYLSTLSYLAPKERPAIARLDAGSLMISDILYAHEIGHQWWGNTVTTAGYRDEWLMESLADYSALLFLEKRRGPRRKPRAG